MTDKYESREIFPEESKTEGGMPFGLFSSWSLGALVPLFLFFPFEGVGVSYRAMGFDCLKPHHSQPSAKATVEVCGST